MDTAFLGETSVLDLINISFQLFAVLPTNACGLRFAGNCSAVCVEHLSFDRFLCNQCRILVLTRHSVISVVWTWDCLESHFYYTLTSVSPVTPASFCRQLTQRGLLSDCGMSRTPRCSRAEFSRYALAAILCQTTLYYRAISDRQLPGHCGIGTNAVETWTKLVCPHHHRFGNVVFVGVAVFSCRTGRVVTEHGI